MGNILEEKYNEGMERAITITILLYKNKTVEEIIDITGYSYKEVSSVKQKWENQINENKRH